MTSNSLSLCIQQQSALQFNSILILPNLKSHIFRAESHKAHMPPPYPQIPTTISRSFGHPQLLPELDMNQMLPQFPYQVL